MDYTSELLATTQRGTQIRRVTIKSTGKTFIAKSFPSKEQADKEFALQKRAADAGFAPKVFGVTTIHGEHNVMMEEVQPVKRPTKLTITQMEKLVVNLFNKTGILQRDVTANNFLFGITESNPTPKDYMIDFGIVES